MAEGPRRVGCDGHTQGGVALASLDRLHLREITNGRALEHLGMELTVMGTLDEATNTIKVTSIKASSQGTPDPGRARSEPAGGSSCGSPPLSPGGGFVSTEAGGGARTS